MTAILQPHPAADKLPMMSSEEYAGIVASMRRVGYDPRKPITLCDGLILDGRNRHKAATEVGCTPTFETLPPDVDPFEFVWRENGDRRHLDAGTRGCVKLQLLAESDKWRASKESADEAADRARSESQKGKPRPRGTTVAPVQPTFRPARTTTNAHVRLAAAAGISPRTAAAVISLKTASPALFDRVAKQEMPLKKAVAEVKAKAKAELGAKLDAAPMADPEGPFDVIGLDPPWQYTKREEDYTHRAKLTYPSMSTDKICALRDTLQAPADGARIRWGEDGEARDGVLSVGQPLARRETARDRARRRGAIRDRSRIGLIMARTASQCVSQLRNAARRMRAAADQYDRAPRGLVDLCALATLSETRQEVDVAMDALNAIMRRCLRRARRRQCAR